MEQRTFVSFEWPSELTEEQEIDGEISPPGLPILDQVRVELISNGFSVSPVLQHDSYGWYIETAVSDVTVWSMLQYSEPWLLINETQTSLLTRLFRRTPAQPVADLCFAIHQFLSGKSKAHDIQWFSPSEFQQRRGENGASSPNAT